MEQKAEHFCLTVWGTPEEGGWILCQVSKQMKNAGRNQSCQAGEEEALQSSLYFLPCALAGAEGRSESPPRGCPCLQTSPAQFAECWGCCCVQHVPVPDPLFPESDCPAAFPLHPVVLPLQVWIFSHQLLAAGCVAGWRTRGGGCWMLSWRQKHLRHGIALSERDKNIRSQNVSVGRYLCQSY